MLDLETHNGQKSLAIGEEVVVETWQVGPAAGDELDTSIDLDCNGILAVNQAEDVLLLLLDLLLQGVEVLDDLSGADEGCECGHIVKRGIVGQQR